MAIVLSPALPLKPLQLQKDLSILPFFCNPPFFSTTRCEQWTYNSRTNNNFKITCRISRTRDPPNSNHTSLTKEAHKYFDHAIITVRAGDGGHGAVLNMPNPNPSPNSKSQGKRNNERDKRKKGSYKRDSDGSLILPMGGHGGDVVIFADGREDSLLEFHKKNRYCAKRGGNVDAMGALNSQLCDGFAAPALRIPVPVGTVVKRKKGKVLADLARPGDQIRVARGGQGGISLLEMPERRRKRLMALSTNVMRDPSDKVLVLGQPGEEVSLELILRVVADVGLVGLPNAGKSTLLASLTLAKPDIADYPFTTLIPNLGRLDGDPDLGPLQFSSEATLADLPGLIEGAHLGKGLGRNFLRHLRRTRLLVHVVDASAHDPVKDYITVREELRMYNPNYLERPYIAVLNKIDLLEARERLPSLRQEISTIGCIDNASQELPVENEKGNVNLSDFNSDFDHEEIKEKELQDYPRPLAVVGASLLKQIGIDEMLREIRAALRKCRDLDDVLEPEVAGYLQ